jgi:lysozyme family protein
MEINDKGFLNAIKEVLGIEGGYVNDKDDPGKATNWGISEAVARRNGFKGDMKDLSKEQAIEIYYSEFWMKPGFNQIKNSKIAGELFEFGVNAGVALAVKVLQRAYNLLNQNDVISEDGVLGPITAKKINNYKFFKSLYATMNILQGMYYIGLAEGDTELINNIKHHKQTYGSKLKKFVRGWIDKRVKTC